MTEFNFDEWFEIWWKIYPRDMVNNIGSKAKTKTYAKKVVKSDEDGKTQLNNLSELIRYRRKAKKGGEHQSKWIFPMAYIFFKDMRYEDEIPSHAELVEKIKNKDKSICIFCRTFIEKNDALCDECVTKYVETIQKNAERYCVQKGLYIRGKTPRNEAIQNMFNFCKRLSKEIYKS